ncbi:asparagine synthase-related protein [Brevundimonas aurantiaca]|uniref:asparagine synthase-related protein n=1 Tax=Brevundimonas aurantiaca TaxID=74316 RepID=UPI0030162830
MDDYLIVSISKASDQAVALTGQLRRLAMESGGRVSSLSAATWLWETARRPQMPTRVGLWLLVGDVVRRQTTARSESSLHQPEREARALTQDFWGRYVGVRLSERGSVTAVLRDPSGARECLVWSQGGLAIIGSTAPAWLAHRFIPNWSVNIERVGQAMIDPLMSAGALMLDGPVAVNPGVFQPLPAERPGTTVWSPVERARSSLSDWTPTEAADRLRCAVDEAVNGLGGLPGTLAVEISGGLDSSIVATSLAASTRDRVKIWLNAYGARPEADERQYVEALGKVLGVSPVSVPHFTAPLTEALFTRISQDVRPGLNALDIHHDLDWSARLGSVGADAVLTGKGGDSILLHSAGLLVAADRWRREGWKSLLSGDFVSLAANNEMSVWTLIASARRARNRPSDRIQLDDTLLRRRLGLGPIHPWLEGSDAYGPAKIFQIAGVVDSVSRHGRSLLTDAVDVRHPLCAQPVVEAGLALPTPLLTLGGWSRGLARVAFRDRLPAIIAERRTKGDMTAIYGRMVFENLDLFKSWLLDGRLAAEGLLDRAAVEARLNRENLMWRGGGGGAHTIIRAAAFEGWLRVWSDRLKGG